MSQFTVQTPAPFLSKRRLGWASAAALIGCCAACGAVPLLGLAGLSGGAVAALSNVLRPGSEFVVGGTVFALVLAGMAVRNHRERAAGRGPVCQVPSACGDGGAAPRSV